jgi:hypothetical protein
VTSLRTDFASRIKRRPKTFKKRVQELVRRYLPPQPKHTGKPVSARVTDACRLLAEQDAQIARASGTDAMGSLSLGHASQGSKSSEA